MAANVKRRVAFMHRLLIDKMCNALLPDAAPSGLFSGVASATAGHMHEPLGGLWVGGRVQASSDAITFTPNGMNAALHSGLQPVRIPLTTVSAARRDFGWLTGIVVVEHAGGEFRFRCFGARGVARILSSHVSGI